MSGGEVAREDVSTRLRDFYERPTVPVRSGQLRTRRLLLLLDDIFRTADRPLRVIDVGCGDGMGTELTTVRAASAGGHHVAGVDWAEGPLKQAAGRGLTLLRGSLEAGLPVASGSVDVVILSEVVEHLVDTDGGIAELHRVLRPGGHLVLSTPNLAAWFNRGLLLAGIQPIFSEVSLRGVYGRPGAVVAGHLRLFTKRALTGFLADRGFTDIRVSGACYHDVPLPLRPLDRCFRLIPGLAAILMVHARKPV
ncbi:MAG TPA: methyltransferase domain-containing protein [Streptosporangiaceae bacterium]|jgi:2-polyprenyl-3-methyl-5-hydroxy-6-metoxy-1,4-benzoquinol methylase|nr:methyltransferase domain-containing protein [Streptosporangiaceae bacterium]